MTATPGQTIKAILTGMAQVACGQKAGIERFGDTARAFLGSLLPGLGFLTGAVIEGVMHGDGAMAFAAVPASLCMLLAPPVFSYELARRWGREQHWYRYCVAFNWCQWLLPVIGLVAINVMGLLFGAGVKGGGLTVLAGLTFYALWINWFLARNGLALTAGRAVLFVFAVNLGVALLMFVPILAAGKMP